jgi:hypothetical protein
VLSKYSPIPGHAEYEQHIDGRVRKASNRHWVTDPFTLDEIGVGTPPNELMVWRLACCGRPWFTSDWYGAREHQLFCIETMISAHPGKRATRKRSRLHRHIGDDHNWGSAKEEIPLLGSNVTEKEFVPYRDRNPGEAPGITRGLVRQTGGRPRQRFAPVSGDLLVLFR